MQRIKRFIRKTGIAIVTAIFTGLSLISSGSMWCCAEIIDLLNKLDDEDEPP